MVVPSRRRPFPVIKWVIPILLILVIGAIAIYDYTQQHIRVNLFGTNVDTATVNSVIIQPAPNRHTKQGYYTVSGHDDIISILKQLSRVTDVAGTDVSDGAVFDSVYVNLPDQEVIQVRIYDDGKLSDPVLLQSGNRMYSTDHAVVDVLTQVEQKLDEQRANS